MKKKKDLYSLSGADESLAIDDPINKSIMDGSPAWFYKPWAITSAILCFGPLGLILLWLSPATRLWNKIFISAVVLILTAWMVRATTDLLEILVSYYGLLDDVLKASS